MSPLPNPWMLLAAVLAVVGAWCHGFTTGDGHGADRVFVGVAKAEKESNEARARRTAQVRDTERELQRKADEDREKAAALARDRDDRIARLERELRTRPYRPTTGPGDVPKGPAGPGAADPAPGGCTGAGLYRDDAEFLAGQSRLASIAKSERDACYVRYREAQQKLRALAAPP